MDPRRTRAQAVAIVGERIVAVGSDADIQKWIGPDTELVELDYLDGHAVFERAHTRGGR